MSHRPHQQTLVKPSRDRIGFALIGAGVAALAGGTFVPLKDAAALSLGGPVSSPTLMEIGGGWRGWLFIALAVAGVAEMARLRWLPRPSHWGLLIGAVALIAVIWVGTDAVVMVTCSADSLCEVADPGIGLLTLGLGGLLTLVGDWHVSRRIGHR